MTERSAHQIALACPSPVALSAGAKRARHDASAIQTAQPLKNGSTMALGDLSHVMQTHKPRHCSATISGGYPTIRICVHKPS
jgi:hypothetical protein